MRAVRDVERGTSCAWDEGVGMCRGDELRMGSIVTPHGASLSGVSLLHHHLESSGVLPHVPLDLGWRVAG
mgnify:CR=1 FL=1